MMNLIAFAVYAFYRSFFSLTVSFDAVITEIFCQKRVCSFLQKFVWAAMVGFTLRGEQ